MSIATLPPPAPSTGPPAVPDLPVCRLSVEQYHRMINAGILVSGEPIELLEGWLTPKMIKKRPRTIATGATRTKLDDTVPKGWYVDSQEPVTTDDSEPEPAVCVVRGELRDYEDRQPGPSEVALVVEVAETSLKQDRGIKKRVYARAKFPIYWIINLIDNQIEVYTDPSGPTDKPDYRQRKDYGPDDEVPVVLDWKKVGRIAVRELLP